MERKHEGWLVKSPPDWKTLFKFIKPKWRRRYFVLYSPPNVCITPGKCQSILSYYEGPEMKKEYGKIDLDTCEEVTSNLDTDNYHFVFAIKTTFRNQKRTYLLAADTNEDITKWMNELGKLLNLADNFIETNVNDIITKPSALKSSQSISAKNSNLPYISLKRASTAIVQTKSRKLRNYKKVLPYKSVETNLDVTSKDDEETSGKFNKNKSKVKVSDDEVEYSFTNMPRKTSIFSPTRRPSNPFGAKIMERQESMIGFSTHLQTSHSYHSNNSLFNSFEQETEFDIDEGSICEYKEEDEIPSLPEKKKTVIMKRESFEKSYREYKESSTPEVFCSINQEESSNDVCIEDNQLEKQSSFDSIYDIPTKASYSSEKLSPEVKDERINSQDEMKDDENSCKDSSFLYDYLPSFAKKSENQNEKNNFTKDNMESIEKTELKNNSERYSSGVFSQRLSLSNLDPDYDVLPTKLTLCKVNSSSTSDLKTSDVQTSYENTKYSNENIETFGDNFSKHKTCFIDSDEQLDRRQFDKRNTYINHDVFKEKRVKPPVSLPKPKINDKKEPLQMKCSLKKNISKSTDFISDLDNDDDCAEDYVNIPVRTTIDSKNYVRKQE